MNRERMTRARQASILGALVVLAAGRLSAAQENAAAIAQEDGPAVAPAIAPAVGPENVPAVWKERNLAFSYASSKTVYSCKALVARVATLLRAIGARDDIEVGVKGCIESVVPSDDRINDRWNDRGRMDVFPRFHDATIDRRQDVDLEVHLRTPVEVSDEVLAELRKDKSRRELVSRVTGNPAARFNDPVMFEARRQAVTLSRKTVGLEPEDCELVDQMARSAFVDLDIKVIRRGTSCDPRRQSRIAPELQVEALMVPQLRLGEVGEPSTENEAGAEPGQRDQPGENLKPTG